MNSKKSNILILILLALSFFSLLSAAEQPIDTKEFVHQIYNKYMGNDFLAVYEFIHPEIKEVLDKKAYIDFQKKNTEKYNIEISEVEVVKIVNLEKLPEIFKEIFKDYNFEYIYEVTIEYKSSYTVAKNKQEKFVEKKTYIVTDQNKDYLLWDPDIIKKD